MKRQLMTLLWLCLAVVTVQAQKITVSGEVTDGETGEALPSATVVLLRPDSTQATGATTNMEGGFRLPAVKAGAYILKVSFVGYKPLLRNLQLTSEQKERHLGVLKLNTDAVLMTSAEVTARAAQVEMKADTFIYNSAAYRVPEGSALEELVRKLPGAEVSDDGTIKINGKEVKKIMVDGKEFFEDDTKMAMKNLPTKMVEKIKAYDKKSDYSRITGIDDGEEETVLDLTVKKGMKEGWLVNTDVGYGTEERYTGKAMVNRFTDHLQFSLIGSANNVNDASFPGGGGGRGGRGGGAGSGLVASKMAGANFAWDNNKKEGEAGMLKLGGNVRYSHTNSDAETKTNSETFLTGNSAGSYANSQSKSLSGRTSVNGNFRLEWAPDTLTNILFRPNFSYNESYSNGLSRSVTFNDDPYKRYTDPLAQYLYYIEEDNTLVNSNNRESRSEGNSKSVDGRLQINRRLSSKGRNITLNASAGYSTAENTSFSISDINYYQETDPAKRSNYTNQYNLSPSKSYNYKGQLSYSEPLFRGANLQFSYSFQYRYSDSDRSMYSLDSLVSKELITRDELYLGYIPGTDWLDLCKNYANSQYATYREYNQEASVMFRYTRGDMRLNAGVSLQPQTTDMDYQKNQLDTTVTRHVFNWAPRVDFRYKFSNTSQLRLRYNGSSAQPSMTNLLDVTDDSDPLNVSKGNPELKPSWTNRFNLFYNAYLTERQMGWMVHANASMTSNSISTVVTYDEQTGKRITQPMNINGNWQTSGALMFNSALGPKKYFNVSTFTNLGYTNAVGYISTNTRADAGSHGAGQPQKSTTKTTDVSERLNLNFRNDLLEVGLNGNLSYQHARNALQTNINLDTYGFSYGAYTTINMPWNMSLSTDVSEESRRGYDDASMNTNEWIWNAQLSQSFLKNSAATVSVQWYDILRQRSNISRTLSATQRADTWTNAINSYVMVHFIYRLNLLGNKEARSAMPRMDGLYGGPERRPGGFGGGSGRGGGGGGFGGPGRH